MNEPSTGTQLSQRHGFEQNMSSTKAYIIYRREFKNSQNSLVVLEVKIVVVVFKLVPTKGFGT